MFSRLGIVCIGGAIEPLRLLLQFVSNLGLNSVKTVITWSMRMDHYPKHLGYREIAHLGEYLPRSSQRGARDGGGGYEGDRRVL